jgi:FkbM family methyltransferase
MPRTGALQRVLQKIVADAPIVYVDCGARAGRLPRWLRPLKNSQYVGFEADAEECSRLNRTARAGHRYIQVFLGRAAHQRAFFLTRSAACASLLQPNTSFLAPFAGLAPLFAVERTILVDTVPLDQCLAASGVTSPDFLELDTQGSELEILENAGSVLGGLAAVRVEVEFAPLYVNQPLFADVDLFLRTRGFELFDLSRYRASRVLPADVETRGQLLWGQALYLRDYRTLAPGRAIRLGVMAALLDRPDLALEIFSAVPPDALTKTAARSIGVALKLLAMPEGSWLARPKVVIAGLAARLLDLAEGDTAVRSRGRTTWRD